MSKDKRILNIYKIINQTSRIILYCFLSLLLSHCTSDSSHQEAKMKYLDIHKEIERVENILKKVKQDSLVDSLKYKTLESKKLSKYIFTDVVNLNTIVNTKYDFPNSSMIIHHLWSYLNNTYGGCDEEPVHNPLVVSLKNNRESKIIELLYKQNRKFILQFLDIEIYKKSELNKVVQALIISYEELQDKDQILEELYIKSQENKPDYQTYKFLISKKVNDLLKHDEELVRHGTFENSKSVYKDVVWCYSFWIRRYQEKNAETVYQILKDIDSIVKSNTHAIEDSLNEGKSYE